MSSNQYTVNIVNADELYIGGRKIQALELGVLVSDDPNFGIGIGTDKPRLKLDISGADGIRIPVGTTSERPINDTFLVANGEPAPNGATNLLGILRYNTTTEKYEAVCDSENLSANPSWCNFVIETGTNVGNNKVGINKGTVTPSQTLDVSGQIGINDYIIHNGDTNTKIGFPTNDTLTITTGGTERMRVSPDGNVGIGTTNPKGNLHVFNSTLNSLSDFLSTSINRLTNEPSSKTDIYYNYLENTLVKELNNSSGYWSSVPRYGFKLGSWRNSNSSGLILKTINSAAIDWKTRLKINHNGFFYFNSPDSNSPDSNLEKFYSPYHFSFKPTGDGKYGNLIPSTNSKINDLTFSNFSTAQTDTKNIFGEYPVFIGKGCSLYSVPSPTLANTKFIAFSKEGSSGQQNFYGGGIMLNDKIHFITYNKTQTTSGLNDSAGNTITDGAELQLSTYTRMTIDQSGNVGIGTTSPKCTLNTNNIMTDSDNTIPVDGGDLNDTTSLFLGKSSSIENNYWGLIMGSTWAAGKGYIQTYNKTQANYKADLLLNPTNGGNVGIGTVSPNYTLDVNGTMMVTGTITGDVTGNLTGNASTATQVYVTESNGDEGYHVYFGSSGHGNQHVRSDPGLLYNPYHNQLYGLTTLYATNIHGTLHGNASTASTANGLQGSPTLYSASGSAGLGHTTLWNNYGEYQLKLAASNNCMVFRVNTSGNKRTALIQVGHNDSGYHASKGNLYLNRWGGGVYYGTSGVSTSDDRIKHNEKPIKNALSIIKQLKPLNYVKTFKMYDRNHHFDLDASGVPINEENRKLVFESEYIYETGLIAQNVREIPELKFCVRGNESEIFKETIFKKDSSGNDILDEDGKKIIEKEIERVEEKKLHMDYNSIFTMHIAATQEIDKIQQAEKTKLEEQTSKLAATETKLEAAEAKIATLENTLADVLTRLAALE